MKRLSVYIKENAVPKLVSACALLLLPLNALSADEPSNPIKTLLGSAAFGDWREDAPGVRRHITVNDLPEPFATPFAANYSQVIARPSGALPKVPQGFEVAPFAIGLKEPRLLRVAPNGDIFVAEMLADRVRVLRPRPDGASPSTIETFAQHLSLPFGISFYPPGPEPQWVYIANTGSIVRFPYRNGDLKARGAPETVVAELPVGGHATRDVAFSPDGKRMFVSVGSSSNAGEDLGPKKTDAAPEWDREHLSGSRETRDDHTPEDEIDKSAGKHPPPRSGQIPFMLESKHDRRDPPRQRRRRSTRRLGKLLLVGATRLTSLPRLWRGRQRGETTRSPAPFASKRS